MFIKAVSSPIGFFDAVYSDKGLRKLSFIGQNRSTHPIDLQLQKSIDSFFSSKGLKSIPQIDLQGTDFQLLVWDALCSIPRGRTASYLAIAKKNWFAKCFKSSRNRMQIEPNSSICSLS